jgi:hypothetical protein
LRELLLHHELYSLRALERTVAAFAEAGDVQLGHEMPYYRATVSGATPEVEEELAGELANYALALTVEEKRAGEPERAGEPAGGL